MYEDEFFDACTDGHLSRVKELLAEPLLDVNFLRDHQTAFCAACFNRQIEVVKVLMADSRVDILFHNKNGQTPFFTACVKGHESIVALLIADPRVDIGLPHPNGSSPFYGAWACKKPNVLVQIAKAIIEKNEDDAIEKDIFHLDLYQFLTWLKDHNAISEDDLSRINKLAPPTDLPQKVLQAIKLDVAQLFAYIVFVCDNYFSINNQVEQKLAAWQRFLNIAQRLPMDQQMVLCNSWKRINRNIVSVKDSDDAFKIIAQAESRRKQQLGSR